MKKVVLTVLLGIAVCIMSVGQGFVIDHTCTDIYQIPEAYLNAARNNLHIGYGHTSHGSQLVTGMSAISTAMGANFSFSAHDISNVLELHEGGDLSGDVGSYPQWKKNTSVFLEKSENSRFNVILWSWCGQLSNRSSENVVSQYLEPMSVFESHYPNVTFIYMTGHLDGTGETGTLHQNNEQIRAFCAENNKILFDFADIESYDPDGNSYLDKKANDECDYDSDGNGSRDANWAEEWCSENSGDCLNTGNCAHSKALNCELKGRAAWWMFARLAGWPGLATAQNDHEYLWNIVYRQSENRFVLMNDQGSEQMNYQVYSYTGTLCDEGVVKNELSLKSLERGLYIVSFSCKQYQKTVKVLVSN